MGILTQPSTTATSNNHCSFCHKKDDYRHQHQCIDIGDLVNDEETRSIQVTNANTTSWTSKQWLILITSMLSKFGCALCLSLQGPFFPAEAARKGVTATTYGFVFSSFSLTVFLLAPVFGKYVAKIGPRFLMNSGIFVTSFCCILFGLLDKMTHSYFVTFAFLVRIVEATGDAAYNAANFATMAATFPEDIGKIFVNNVLLTQSELSILQALRIPSVSLSMTAVCFGTVSISFLSATLEAHLRQFNLNAIQVGSVFIISGGVFAVTAILWGWLFDGKVPPKILIAIGACFMCCTYILIGPAPFLPFDSSLALCIIALTFHGFGTGTQMLTSHIDAVKHSM
uniref:Major facilitator superfamily (MFS) profile domain-containing protein n=1 Tax=Strigamia maritima TaxID=126957 RepID=T1J2X8_STRMM